MQEICNSNYQLMWVSSLKPGASRDSAALACSHSGQLLNDASYPFVKLLIREGWCISADNV